MKTKFIYFWKTILSNKISFIALLVFACFCGLFYVGISSSGESLYSSSYNYVSNQQLHDYIVASPLGFSDEDVESMKEIDGIDSAEGRFLDYDVFEYGEIRFIAKILQITENIDIITITKGTMPRSSNQIAVEGVWAKEKGLKLGDTISVSDTSSNKLKENHFVITAFAETPEYFVTNTFEFETTPDENLPIGTAVFVSKDAFDVSRMNGYTQVLLRSNKLRDFKDGSSEYRTESNELKKLISSSIKPIIYNRYQNVKDLLHLQGTELQDDMATNVALFSRDELVSVCILDMNKKILDNMKNVFTVPFIAICLLICVSIILRITKNEENLIGIQLSMGTKKVGIVCRYIAFCFLPVFLGTILGCLLGRFAVAPIFLKYFVNVWFFEKAIYVLNFTEAIMCVVIVTLTIAIASAISCVVVFRKNVLDMINKTDDVNSREAFYEKTKLWHKMPLLTKSIVKNMFTDRLRVFGTLIGIVGCTALLVSSFCMNNSLESAIKTQFGHIQDYESIVYFDPKDESAEQNIIEILQDNNVRCSPVFSGTAYISASDGETSSIFVFASDNEFDNLIRFYNKEGESLTQGEGILLSRAYASYYNVQQGDIISFFDNEKNEYEVVVDGVFDFYLTRQEMIFTKEAYEKLTGETCLNNAILVDNCGLESEKIDSLLRNTQGYYYTYDYKFSMEKLFSLYKILATVAFVLKFVLSIALALFVLQSIFSQFILEKKAELITLMINGYSTRFVHKYLYIDTIILSAIGFILGAVVGNLIGCNDISTLKSAYSFYPSGFDIVAILCGIGIVAVFTAVICIRALKQIDKLEISDINK